VTRISATEASRSFSEVLSRVAAGEEIEITRAGTPVAVIAPPPLRALSAKRFRELMASAPSVDGDFLGATIAIREESAVPESRRPS
jgi:prevent-host-death family protein